MAGLSPHQLPSIVALPSLYIYVPTKNETLILGQGHWDNTSYDSAIWTAKGNDQTNFNSQFWSANVTEVCLTSDAFSIRFSVNNVQAPSLLSLFFQKNTLNISKDLWNDALEDGIADPAFEENCYETGFNVGDPNYIQARIGIVNLDNPGTGCTPSGPQAIGVGIKVAGQGYGSVHGVVAGNTTEYHDVSVYVRSKPDP
ncbi:Hypothetical predicted protein [Paramuricea clavata]|uniref:Uncharacterized protein n=1 Tax=Paramuricea clavata TaxID=317549 RepID=A0A7D9JCN3_PARCT|nr:Hypothetical predicted protein [Paramuricea clavata]